MNMTNIDIEELKDGWATLQFNAFLQGKVTTQRMGGGNHEQFYSQDGTYLKSKMLEDMHPDVAKVVWRFNRHHHHVDYKPFKKNPLGKKEEWTGEEINNYGMKIIQLDKKDFDEEAFLEEIHG
jgi:hypothetical protein